MSSAAGWFPQPDGSQRYWDGDQWTEHFAPGIVPVTPQAVTPSNKGGSLMSEFTKRTITVVLAVLFLAGVAGFVYAFNNKPYCAITLGLDGYPNGKTTGWCK